ncbi:MAG: hypothetical protein ABSD59_01110 [Terracidiphilus sp.]|jgi:hypothetical protein
MKPFALALTLAVTIGAIGAHASSLSLTLTPASGAVGGAPGTAVGWGFTLTDTSNSDWIILDDSFFTGSPVYGTYTDYIANQFYVAGPSPEPATVVSPWNQSAQTGTGEFDLYATDPSVSFSGTISVDYSLYSEDPNSPDFDPDSLISSGTFTDPVSISVTPEPPTWALMILPFAALLAAFAKRSSPKHAS